jgi:hypothetical protein
LSVLFGAALLVGAALLFIIEPLIGRKLLPWFGGSPAVWNTSLVFFQATLLASYVYVHIATTWLGVRRQSVLHAGLLVLALPLWVLHTGAPWRPVPAASAAPVHPTGELIALLLTTVGLPFFVVAGTAPLLQRWYVAIGPAGARDPYFLYGISNLGSLLGLLTYPLAIEPNFALAEQERLWAIGYLVLALLMLACTVAVWRSGRTDSPITEVDRAGDDRPDLFSRLRWMALAFVPSSLLLGVTTFLTTDVAPVALLWVIPLALYLLSFVLVFARRPLVPHTWTVRALPLTVTTLVLVLAAGLVQPFWIPVHLATFFLIALVCHGELARLRPLASGLTAYYLAIAGGGVAGGSVNALVAPIVFDRVAEYPLGVFLACLCLPGVGRDLTGRGRGLTREGSVPLVIALAALGLVRNVGGLAGSWLGPLAVMLASGLAVLVLATAGTRPLRFALGIAAMLLAGGMSDGVDGRVVYRERTFFGVHRVTEITDQDGRLHRLFHGSTLHGQQRLAPGWQRQPLAYYHRSGPIGQVIEVVQARPRPCAGAPLRVAVVGLGAGSLAAYARPGERWTFYEIDPAVVRIARDERAFTFLRDNRAETLDVVVGDARLRLRAVRDRTADLLVLDAFSSDAIPTHLLTREAVRLYRAKLADGGLIALHLSNRAVDLDPVVGQLARDAGLAALVRTDATLTRAERAAGKSTSIWAVLAARPADLGPLASDHRWRPPRLLPGDRVWTDDYCNVLGHLRQGLITPFQIASDIRWSPPHRAIIPSRTFLGWDSTSEPAVAYDEQEPVPGHSSTWARSGIASHPRAFILIETHVVGGAPPTVRLE